MIATIPNKSLYIAASEQLINIFKQLWKVSVLEKIIVALKL